VLREGGQQVHRRQWRRIQRRRQGEGCALRLEGMKRCGPVAGASLPDFYFLFFICF
jgi:hypothetical protein